MALVDVDYQFIYVDIDDYGSQSDGAVFKNSNLGQAFVNGELDTPEPKELPNYPEGGVLSYCWVGNEAFPCRMDLMQPYPRGTRGLRFPLAQKSFNYRLSCDAELLRMHLASWSRDGESSTGECNCYQKMLTMSSRLVVYSTIT